MRQNIISISIIGIILLTVFPLFSAMGIETVQPCNKGESFVEIISPVRGDTVHPVVEIECIASNDVDFILFTFYYDQGSPSYISDLDWRADRPENGEIFKFTWISQNARNKEVRILASGYEYESIPHDTYEIVAEALPVTVIVKPKSRELNRPLFRIFEILTEFRSLIS